LVDQAGRPGLVLIDQAYREILASFVLIFNVKNKAFKLKNFLK
jgi:hypothetical protein